MTLVIKMFAFYCCGLLPKVSLLKLLVTFQGIWKLVVCPSLSCSVRI